MEETGNTISKARHARRLHPSEQAKADTVSRADCTCWEQVPCPTHEPINYSKHAAKHKGPGLFPVRLVDVVLP